MTELLTILTNLQLFLLITVLTIIAYWRRIRLLYCLSGLALMVYGFYYLTTNLYMSIITVVAGVVSFVMAWKDKE